MATTEQNYLRDKTAWQRVRTKTEELTSISLSNAPVEAIASVLESVVPGGGGSDPTPWNQIIKEVDLPTALQGQSYYYTQALPNGDVLISGDTSASGGLWVYSKADNTITQKHALGYRWCWFHVLPDGDCLIGTAGATNGQRGLLRYNYATQSITVLLTANTQLSYFIACSKGVIITAEASSASYFYDYSTRLLTTQINTNRLMISYEIEDVGVLLSSRISTSAGIWFFDYGTKKLLRLTTYLYDWNTFTPVASGSSTLIGGTYNSAATGNGLWLFNHSTKTISQVETTGRSLNVHMKSSNGDVIIGSDYSLAQGCWLYNSSTGLVEKLSSQYGYWQKMFATSNGVLASSGTSNTGLWFYNNYDRSFTQIETIGSNYGFHQVPNGVLAYTGASSGAGIWYFKDATATLSRLTTTSYAYEVRYELSHGCLLSGRSSWGALLYFDYNTETVTFTNTYSGFAYGKEVQNGCLLTGPSQGTHALMYFKESTLTLTPLVTGAPIATEAAINAFNRYVSFVKSQAGSTYAVAHSNYEPNAPMIRFDEATETMTAIPSACHGESYLDTIDGHECVVSENAIYDISLGMDMPYLVLPKIKNGFLFNNVGVQNGSTNTFKAYSAPALLLFAIISGAYGISRKKFISLDCNVS